MRLALIIEYEGTQYHGFQLQSNAPSIQGELEKALTKLTREEIRVKGAGRTDTGVHALGQVVAFNTSSQIQLHGFVNGLNFYLPEDIAVKAAYQVGNEFEPRYDATSRMYRYTILNDSTPSPLERRFTCMVRRQLNAEAMDKAARILEGTHDCAPFSGILASRSKKTVREVFYSRVTKVGNKILFDIRANSFLPQQVRRTVGALVNVGLEKISLGEFLDLARSGLQGAATLVMPPQGLCMVEVTYREFPTRLES